MKWLFNTRWHLLALRELAALVTRHRQLTMEMARRELTDRYLGQVLGSLWLVGHPIMLMGVYVFIFAYVFRMKVGGTAELPLDYTAYLLSGLIPWLSFQESMSKGSTAISANANLVKQVVFPIEILPVKGVVASLATMLVFLCLLTVYVLFSHGFIHWTYALLPGLIFFQMLAMIGIAYVLSSVGAYFRDIKDLVQIFSVVGAYLMPVFYLPEQMPELFRPLLYFNPFSYLVWCWQDALYYGRFEHWWAWAVFPVFSTLVFYTGYRVFRKLKPMFGNVL